MIIELFNFKVGQKVRYKDGSIFTIKDFIPISYDGYGTEKFIVHFEESCCLYGTVTYTKRNERVRIKNFTTI